MPQADCNNSITRRGFTGILAGSISAVMVPAAVAAVESANPEILLALGHQLDDAARRCDETKVALLAAPNLQELKNDVYYAQLDLHDLCKVISGVTPRTKHSLHLHARAVMTLAANQGHDLWCWGETNRAGQRLAEAYLTLHAESAA